MATSAVDTALEATSQDAPVQPDVPVTGSLKRKTADAEVDGAINSIMSEDVPPQRATKKHKTAKPATLESVEGSDSTKTKTHDTSQNTRTTSNITGEAQEQPTKKKRKADDSQRDDSATYNAAGDDQQPPAKRTRRKAKAPAKEVADTSTTSKPEIKTLATDTPTDGGRSGLSSLKRKEADRETTAHANGDETEGNPQPPAKRRKKADPAVKKPKAETAKIPKAPTKPKTATPRAKKTTSPETPKPKRTRKTKARNEETAPAPPLPPTKVSWAVATKIKQVKEFISENEETKLERDPLNIKLITVTELNLLGAVMHMRVHYEIGLQQDASVSDVQEAIVETMQRPIGLNPEPVNWVVVDVSKKTAFEAQINEKIARHGLDDVSLLETELELIRQRELQWVGVFDSPAIFRHAENVLNAVKEGFSASDDEKTAEDLQANKKAVSATSEAMRADSKVTDDEVAADGKPQEAETAVRRASAGSDEGEVGRVGVCVAPIHEY
jgi:hypothetical protein